MRILALIVLVGLASCAKAPKGGYIGGLPLKTSDELGRVAVAASTRDVNVDAVESALIEQATGRLTIVARSEQAALAKEKALQYGGDFSDEAVVALGRQIGAKYLFVGRGEVVELPKARKEIDPIPCAKKYSPSTSDEPKVIQAKRAQRENCEEQNAEAQRASDRAFERESPRRRYKLKMRVVDVSSGAFVANADFVGDEGDFGECDFDCIRDKAARRTVRFLLTGSGLKPPPPK